MDKLGIFHTNQTSMCLDPHQIKELVWYRETSLSPPYFLTDRSKAVLHLWIFLFVFVSVVLSYLCLAALWSPAGKGLTSWLSCM